MVNYPTAPAFSQRVIPRLTGQALGEDPFHKREPHIGDKNGWTDSTSRFSLALSLAYSHARQAGRQAKRVPFAETSLYVTTYSSGQKLSSGLRSGALRKNNINKGETNNEMQRTVE